MCTQALGNVSWEVNKKEVFFRLPSFVAERRGFEPRIPFGGIHAFQACLLSHSSIFPC